MFSHIHETGGLGFGLRSLHIVLVSQNQGNAGGLTRGETRDRDRQVGVEMARYNRE